MMRILILPYNVEYNCPCIWTVHVIQSCTIIRVGCTMSQDKNFIILVLYCHSRIKQYINGTLETLEISPTHLFCYWIEDSKTYAHADT